MRKGFVAVLVAVFLPGLLWFTTQRSGNDRIAGQIPLRDEGHPVLLVVDAEGISASHPRRPDERWFDLEWVNILTQGYGGCDVASTSDAQTRLAGRQLVVLPRRTAASLGEDLLDAIGDQVRNGLDVLVEAPDTSLCHRFGLELAAIERRPKLPWPTPVATASRPALTLRPQPVPVPWTRFRYAPLPGPPSERPRVHLSLDGRPMGWSRAHGQGAWLALGVDFAELSARLRHGEDGEALLDGPDDAWLDAWIEGICGAALTALPLARVATVPPDADGWMVVCDSLAPIGAPDRAGWDFGTGTPSRPLLPDGSLGPAYRARAVYRGRPEDIEIRRLDRWARRNSSGGASPLVLEFGSPPAGEISREIEDLARLRNHASAPLDSLENWWHRRRSVRVFVETGTETVDYRVESLPAQAVEFGLLVPVRWRERSLEGWEADWGFAAGRRVRRFDRDYRLIALDADAEGGRLKLRYR